MEAAWFLTILAVFGVVLGLLFGRYRVLSRYLAAAGGGLLFGVALFWLMPEIAALSGWTVSVALVGAACAVLLLIDHFFFHLGTEGGRLAILPLLTAAAMHSFLDGWSLRALSAHHVAGVAAPVGLMLHKIPEGLALGWSTRRSLLSPLIAAAASIGVELLTLAGAYLQPSITNVGFEAFGAWWTSSIIAVVGGSFLFLGFHALLPDRKNAGVLFTFLTTLALTATVGLVRKTNV